MDGWQYGFLFAILFGMLWATVAVTDRLNRIIKLLEMIRQNTYFTAHPERKPDLDDDI